MSLESYDARMWDVASGTRLWDHDQVGGNPHAMLARFASAPALVALACDGLVLDAARVTDVARLAFRRSALPFHSGGSYAWNMEGSSFCVCEVRTGERIAEVRLPEL